jgi:hypothetical protein
MRNPDKWQPQEPGPPQGPPSRRAAIIGLVLIALLIVGGLLLSHILGGMSQFQDCVLSGRIHCG